MLVIFVYPFVGSMGVNVYTSHSNLFEYLHCYVDQVVKDGPLWGLLIRGVNGLVVYTSYCNLFG